jgi:preprotein translocase subunit SecD/SecD/SecF fusion protein
VLYFSKIKLSVIYFIIILLSFFSFLNFINIKDTSILSKNINLGLDLQGGSYLLLEVDSNPIINQNLQQKAIKLRKFLKENKLKYENLSFQNQSIKFNLSINDIDIFKELFLNKDNQLNIYYGKYRAYEMDYNIVNNKVEILYSKYGIIELKISSLDQSLEVVRRRIDEVGTNEPTIIKRGNDRILIELPGLEDPNRIKKLLGRTANLTFRLVNDGENVFGSELLSYEEDEEKLNVSKRIILSGDNLLNAQPALDSQTNEAVVNFTFDRAGSKKFGKATSDNVGRRVAIILDNKIISAPVVREPILTGQGQISGNFTFQSATDLALMLRAGALPAPLKIIEERTVGPDLGEDSIRAGTISLLIGFLLVIIYMLYKYRQLGIIADLALIINLLLLLGILTILEATLTLPGIAGIILTVGMAVDANVLIFERIKEECKNEKRSINHTRV